MSRRFQYVVARYVPSVLRDEAVNVGVIIREVGTDDYEFKFLPRSSTVRRLWPSADERLVGHFQRQLVRARRAWEGPSLFVGQQPEPALPPLGPDFFAWARREMNGNLQVTEPRGLVAVDGATALRTLYRDYVAPPEGGARPINYQHIAPLATRVRLWKAFEDRNLLRHKLVAREVIVDGKHAPWTFDLGYRNGSLRLISSLALNAPAPDINLGRALVLKGMIEDVKAVTPLAAGTAVVYAGRREALIPGIADARSILADAAVEIVPFDEVGILAERIGEELAHPPPGSGNG